MYKTESMTARDGKTISLKVWEDVASPRGVLQLVHGMAEHVSRYDDFATYLNREGWIVLGDDHRAHGDTDPDALGLAGDGDLFENTVADLKQITALAKDRYGLPVVLLGHSYGSFLTQRYLTYGTDDIAAVILMGSAAMQGFVVNFGRKIADARCRKGKRDEAGKFFADQTFVKYDKHIRDGVNGWLSRDKAQVQKYNADPQCNFLCSNGFYASFFAGLQAVARDTGTHIRKDLPMLIVSGDADGVGGYGKLVRKLNARYSRFGLDPRLHLVPGGRHEILNETDKEDTYAVVRDFLAAIT